MTCAAPDRSGVAIDLAGAMHHLHTIMRSVLIHRCRFLFHAGSLLAGS
jgi:hypothetical protein